MPGTEGSLFLLTRVLSSQTPSALQKGDLMPNHNRPRAGRPPRELRDLARYLEIRGYTLAFPFDDIRKPGYIGGFNDQGQEIIIDDGGCLKDIPTQKPKSVVLGDFRRKARFGLRAFVGIFGEVLGLDFGFLRVRRVAIKFPRHFLQTQYIPVMVLDEYWEKIRPACRTRITDPDNFLILQALTTDSIAYEYEIGKRLDSQAQLEIERLVKTAASVKRVGAKLTYHSRTSFTIEIQGKPLCIGYKTATLRFTPLKPAAMVQYRLEATK